MNRVLLAATLLLATQGEDAPARAALERLSARFSDVRTISCKVVQNRKTALLDKPIVSSGTMIYRRDPARLVFRMEQPRRSEIHIDRTSYQVLRPDEKRLERLEFEKDEAAARLLMIFQPRPAEIGKTFAIRRGESAPGEIGVTFEPSDEKVRRHMTRLSLTLSEADSALKRITYVDADGDETRFDLSDLALNPELPADAFQLKLPEGTRVLTMPGRTDK